MKRSIVPLALAAALSACGGGGDGGGVPPQQSPQGFWSGTDFSLLVTPGGELWGVEFDGVDLFLYNGTFSASGSSFTANGYAYLGPDRIALSATGTFTPGSTMSGTVTVPNIGSSQFSAAYSSNYDAMPAAVSALAGTYTLSTGGSLALDSTGSFSGSEDGCSFSGNISPDSSGKNFYRLAVTFGPSPCIAANSAGNGVVAAASSTTLVGGVVSGTLGQAVVLTRN